MDPMQAWLESSFDLIRAGFAPQADGSTREHAATACLSLHAMLVPGRVHPLGPSAPPPPHEPDMLDALIQRFESLLPTANAPTSFRPTIIAPAVDGK